MLLPFPVLLQSQIQKRKKAVLMCLLTLGTFITIIQIIRIRTVKNLANYLDSASLIMWSTVENNLGIIVASIPTLSPLFRYFAERSLVGSTTNTGHQSHTMYSLRSTRVTRLRDTNIGPSEGGSEEFILGDSSAIRKKTEVTISEHTFEAHAFKNGVNLEITGGDTLHSSCYHES